MKTFLLSALLCLSLFANQGAEEFEAKRVAHEIHEDETGEVLKTKIDFAMTSAIDLASQELSKVHEERYANDLYTKWHSFYGASLFSLRGIGAHTPASVWIADQYEIIESILGRDMCIRTHIADIKSLNFGVPVVVHPCTFLMDGIEGARSEEYKRHFAGKSNKVQDEPYNGAVPVVTYWAIYAGCMIGTQGTGYSVVCGTASDLGEKFCANYIAPPLSDYVFNKSCGVQH